MKNKNRAKLNLDKLNVSKLQNPEQIVGGNFVNLYTANNLDTRGMPILSITVRKTNISSRVCRNG